MNKRLIYLALLVTVGLALPVKAVSETEHEAQFDVRLQSISLSADEIVNPMRGLYTSFDATVAPTPRPPFLNYKSFLWSEVETSPHHFDFGKIDSEIAKAVAVNGKVAFRIMSCNPHGSAAQPHVGVPADLVAQLKKGYFIDDSSFQGHETWKLYVPDYNDPIYIARAKELINALAGKYNGDPRIAYVEAGLIGSWGRGQLQPDADANPKWCFQTDFYYGYPVNRSILCGISSHANCRADRYF